MKSFSLSFLLFFIHSSPIAAFSLFSSSPQATRTSSSLSTAANSQNHDNNEQQDRRTVINKAATGIVSAAALLTTTTTTEANAIDLPFGGEKEIPKVPIDQLVNKLEKGKYFGPDIQRMKRKENNYIANSNGAPEKHLPNVIVNGNDIEIQINHVMKDDHYIQFIWLREMENDEVVLVKACTPNEEKPFLKARVPSGVTLTPCLFCNLHGLWKGEPFTVV